METTPMISNLHLLPSLKHPAASM